MKQSDREKAAIQICNFLLACLPGCTTLVAEQREKIVEHLIIGCLKKYEEEREKK